MIKPLLTTLLLTIGLNANIDANTIPIHFYDEGKIDEKQSVFQERGSLEIEAAGNKNRTKLVKGLYWKAVYHFNDVVKKKDFIAEVKRNILKKGGTIHYPEPSFIHASMDKNGKKYWFSVTYLKKSYSLRVVEEKAVEIKISSKVKIDLNKDSFRFYGLKFDSGKFTLLQGSEDDLNKIEKLLREFPNLKIRIEGHTDNKGSSKPNKILSEKRAEAVKEALILRGIENFRLETKGFGGTKILKNATDAENRRVEIVKLGLKDKSISIDKFLAVVGYEKNVKKLNSGKTIRAYYNLIDGNMKKSEKEIVSYYKKLILTLGGKIIGFDNHKLSFSFKRENIEGRLTLLKESYYLSLITK